MSDRNIPTTYNYYYYPQVDLSSQGYYQPWNINYATLSSFYQPYQYQNFSHFYYPINPYDVMAALRQSLDMISNVQAQTYTKQKGQKKTKAAQQRTKSYVKSTVQAANSNDNMTQYQPPPVLPLPPQPNIHYMNNYDSVTSLDGGSTCAWRPAARQAGQ